MFLNKLLTSKTRGRLLAGLVVCGAFLGFKATVHPGFFPGESVRQVAIALNQEPNVRYVRRVQHDVKEVEQLLSPRIRVASQAGRETQVVVRQETRLVYHMRNRFWRLISSAVARLPLGPLPARMNLLAAGFGALTAGLLFALMRGLLLLFTFHISPISSRRRKIAGAAAGLAAAAALGFSAPFWLASTRCLPNTFETFLMVAMGCLLLTAAVRHREWPLTLFGILLGISLFESDTGVWMAPLMVFFAIRAIRVGDLPPANAAVAWASGMALGIVAYLLLNWFIPHGTGQTSFLLPFRELSQGLRILFDVVFGGWMEDSLRLLILCFIIMPLLAVVAMSIWGDPDASGLSSGLLLLTLLGTSTIALTGSSISPWGAYRLSNEQHLPTMLYLVNAVVIGFLVGQGCLMAGGRFFPDVTRVDRRRPRPGALTRDNPDSPLGRLLMGYVCVLLVATGAYNIRVVLDWRELLSSHVAIETVRRLDGCRWVVSDGTVDSLIRLHAQMAGRWVGTLNETESQRLADMRNRRRILSDVAFAQVDGERLLRNLSGSNAVSFVQALMGADPAVEAHVWVMHRPELWEAVGRRAIPDIVGYRGLNDGTTVDWDALLQDSFAFWDRVEKLPAMGPHAPVWLRGHRAQLRQQIFNVGAKLADELAQAGRTDDAKRVLDRANRIKDEPLPSSADSFY